MRYLMNKLDAFLFKKAFVTLSEIFRVVVSNRKSYFFNFNIIFCCIFYACLNQYSVLHHMLLTYPPLSERFIKRYPSLLVGRIERNPPILIFNFDTLLKFHLFWGHCKSSFCWELLKLLFLCLAYITKQTI